MAKEKIRRDTFIDLSNSTESIEIYFFKLHCKYTCEHIVYPSLSFSLKYFAIWCRLRLQSLVLSSFYRQWIKLKISSLCESLFRTIEKYQNDFSSLSRYKWVRGIFDQIFVASIARRLVALVNYQLVFHGLEDIRTGGVKPRIRSDSRSIRRQRAKTRLHGKSQPSSRAFFWFLGRICDGRGTRPNWLCKNKTNFERLEGNHRESKLCLLIFRAFRKKANYDLQRSTIDLWTRSSSCCLASPSIVQRSLCRMHARLFFEIWKFLVNDVFLSELKLFVSLLQHFPILLVWSSNTAVSDVGSQRECLIFDSRGLESYQRFYYNSSSPTKE